MIRTFTVASLFALSLLAAPAKPVASLATTQTLKDWPIPTCSPCTFPWQN